jgi:hypothetical protein
MALTLKPTLFLDFDDVLVLNRPYGGYDVVAPNPPRDLWERLFHRPAVDVLQDVLHEFSPRVVISTSWLRLLDRDGFLSLFAKTNLHAIAESLHGAWEVTQPRHATRHDAIAGWLGKHHRGEPYVVLDDTLSGSGLAASDFDVDGRVVLCDENVGLLPAHLPAIRKALATVPKSSWTLQRS